MTKKACAANMQLGGVREYPQDIRSIVGILRCMEVVTGDAGNIDVHAIVDDHNVFLTGRHSQHRISGRVEVDGIIVAAAIAFNLTVLSRLYFNPLLFQGFFTEIVLNFSVDGFERSIHIDIIVIKTERTIFRAAGVSNILAFVGRTKIHVHTIVIRVVCVAAKIRDFATDKRADLMLCTGLANHVSRQVQIAANGNLAHCMDCGDIVLHKQIEIVEDVMQVIRPTIPQIGPVRGFYNRSACGVSRSRSHAAKYYRHCCNGCKQTLFQFSFSHRISPSRTNH